VEADDVGLHKPSLDDVFLAVTGSTVDQQVDDDAAAPAVVPAVGRGRRR
jgi:hypothetical protein